jgi:hypothetical protein
MTVEPYQYRGYNGPDPVRRCRYTVDWIEVSRWMWTNDVEFCLLRSGGDVGYVFVVESRRDWFTLRWT